jgi:AcrR family transcriptional regulator
MPIRDADATRARIMAAATAEFAEHGLAGGRVDRIAAAARTNKAQLYHYFGNKETLFDVVFDRYVDLNLANVPLDADHLPEYAVDIYDYYLRDPVLGRPATCSSGRAASTRRWSPASRSRSGAASSSTPSRRSTSSA